MKRSLVVLFCMLFAITATYAKDEKKNKGKETITFQVDGMDCNNCVKKIEKNISFEKGVTDLKCDLETRTAEVTYKSDKTCPKTLAAAFEKIGMKAIPAVEDECCEKKAEGCCEKKESGCCGEKKEGSDNKNCCEADKQ